MRIRTDNPHGLPPRLYERENKRSIVWFYKYADGSPRVLGSANRDDPQAVNAGRQGAICTAQTIAASGIKSPGAKKPAPPKLRKRPGSVRPVEKKDLSRAPMWAWNLYRKAKADAHRRGIQWQLSPNEFAWLVRVAQDRCQVTGLPFDIPTSKKRGPFGPSIDRIESSQPYHISNVRLVCVAANIAMNSWGLEVFLKIAEAAIRHRDGLAYSNDCRSLEYKPFQQAQSASGYSPASPLNPLAEWTGLEPATPGVTGRCLNTALTRLSGVSDIPKTP